MDKLTGKYLLCVLLTVLLTGNGCFTIPFLGHSGPPNDFQPQQRDFDSTSVFVGYDGHERPIVEVRLISEEVTADKGLLIKTKLFTTENFEVVNIFRGLRSINYYPIERRFHRLELKYGRHEIKMKVSENLQIKGDKPVDADFEHTGVYQLLPDTIDALKLKFQDVDHWGKMPEDTLAEWYAAKDQYYQLAERRQRRSSLVESYRRLQKEDYTKTFTQYDSLYVTTNNAYVYLEKDVSSDILYTLGAGDQVDYGVSDGIWVEIPTPDSLKPELMDLFEKRQQEAIKQRDTQRRLARTSRGGGQLLNTDIDTTLKFTGYMLDVMVQKQQEQAIAWEKDNMLPPVDVPLFAQVLSNREAAKLARRDSIAKAIQDSIKAISDSIAAVAVADSAAADSAAARAAAKAASAKAPNAKAPVAAATDTGATAAAKDSSAAKTPAAVTGPGAKQATAAADSTGEGGHRRHRIIGPNGQVWEGEGPPPWAGHVQGGGGGPGNAPQPPQAPRPDSTVADSTAPADSSSAPAPDSSSAATQPPPSGSP